MRTAQLVLVAAICVSGVVMYQKSQSASEIAEDGSAEPSEAEELLAQKRLGQHRVRLGRGESEVPAVPAPEDLPRRWSELNDEAIAALGRGELEKAVELFERCLEGQPEQRVFAKNLAEALARLARRRVDADASALAASLPLLERATELDPERRDLRDLLDRWRASVDTEKDFWTDETAHFTLSYDGERTELLRHGYAELSRLLENAYDEFGVTLNHYPVGHGDPKLRVLLYDRDEFTQITGVGHWAGGIFDGTIRVPVADYRAERQSIERVLRHELMHAFLRSYGGSQLPAWLNEGIAQHFEGGDVTSRVQQSRAKLAGQTPFSLDELIPNFTGMNDEGRIAVAYAQSMVIVDYLYRWYGDGVVLDLVRGCKEGKSCPQTFRERTAMDLEQVAADALQDQG